MTAITSARKKFESELATLVARFDNKRAEYLRSDYTEAHVRLQFIDPLLEALGWDVRDHAGHGRTSEVIVERGETQGKPDYTFRIDGVTKFYVEAKAPHVSLEKSSAALQAKKYAWNTPEPFVYFAVATDFEEFRFYDASRKPDPRHPHVGLIFAYRYDEYLTPKALDDLWQLSRESVAAGSLDKLLKPSARAARARAPLDQVFLADLTLWREKLAKSIFKAHPELANPIDLNNVVQVFLDRLIFIRVAEDRNVLEAGRLVKIARAWKDGDHASSIMAELLLYFRDVSDRLNGEIFRKHRCEELRWDSALVAEIVLEGLEPYDFNKIGVELLGSIYERYLGKTIRVTETRAVVEDKPEVRKAGGVYYTPKYIVDYIVEQTVGKLIDGKTPKQIEKLKILDPACGSGSFLIGAYQKLLDYHAQYLAQRANRRGGGNGGQALLLEERAAYGDFKLSLEQKAAILRNNIFGVDIDPQAVEITMMSLYIKMLEGERGAMMGQGVLPRLNENIKCGNSLIARDIADGRGEVISPAVGGTTPPAVGGTTPRAVGGTTPRAVGGTTPRAVGGTTPPLRENDWVRINPFDWDSQRDGFGAIMNAGGFDAVIGNPPYGATLGERETEYLARKFKYQDYQLDTYLLFMEKGIELLANHGLFGMIIPNTWLLNLQSEQIRRYLFEKTQIENIVHYRRRVFPQVTVDTEIIIIAKQMPEQLHQIRISMLDRDNGKDEYLIAQARWQNANGKPVNILERPELNRLADKLRAMPVLDTLYVVTQGAKPFQVGKGQPKQTQKIVDEKPFVAERKVNKTFRPLLRGSLIQRYAMLWNNDYWISFGDWLAEPRYSANYDAPAKIVIRQTGDSLVATLDQKQFVVRDNLYTIVSRASDIDLRYLLGLLNSRLLNWFYQTILNPEKGEALAQVKRGHIAQLPIRTINFDDRADKARHDKLVALVEKMLDLHQQKNATTSDAVRERIEREITVTDEHIDALVYELYGLTQDEIKIVEQDGLAR